MQDPHAWWWRSRELEKPSESNVEVSMIKGSGKAGEGVAGVGKARDSEGKADDGKGEASYGKGKDIKGKAGDFQHKDGKGKATPPSMVFAPEISVWIMGSHGVPSSTPRPPSPQIQCPGSQNAEHDSTLEFYKAVMLYEVWYLQDSDCLLDVAKLGHVLMSLFVSKGGIRTLDLSSVGDLHVGTLWGIFDSMQGAVSREIWSWNSDELEEPSSSKGEIGVIKGSGKAGEGVAGSGKAGDSEGRADDGIGNASYVNDTDVTGTPTDTERQGRLHPARLLVEVMGSNGERPTKSPSFQHAENASLLECYKAVLFFAASSLQDLNCLVWWMW